MCDVQGCCDGAIKTITLISKTPNGDVKSKVSLCNKHLSDLMGTKGYSIGCSPESLNKKLHEILGSGLELYLLVVVPLIQIPKMINIYKNPPYDSIIKLRLQIGK